MDSMSPPPPHYIFETVQEKKVEPKIIVENGQEKQNKAKPILQSYWPTFCLGSQSVAVT